VQVCAALLRFQTGATNVAAALASAALIGFAAPAAASANGGCAGANVRPSATNLNLMRTATLCLIDRARSSAGARAVRANVALRAVAGHQVADMIRYDYFSDMSPTGQSPAALTSAAHYAPPARALTAEDIGWGTGYYATPARIVSAWLHSAPHRAIMLDSSFRDIGVGVIAAAPRSLSAGQGGATYAIELGTRLR
jgi:uncharacterized protein YkwD